jgi:hypothetical protein
MQVHNNHSKVAPALQAASDPQAIARLENNEPQALLWKHRVQIENGEHSVPAINTSPPSTRPALASVNNACAPTASAAPRSANTSSRRLRYSRGKACSRERASDTETHMSAPWACSGSTRRHLLVGRQASRSIFRGTTATKGVLSGARR